MKAQASERNIENGCIKITAPLLRVFSGVVGNYVTDDATTNRMKAPSKSFFREHNSAISGSQSELELRILT